jgi:hypothetical protein
MASRTYEEAVQQAARILATAYLRIEAEESAAAIEGESGCTQSSSSGSTPSSIAI